MGGDVLTMCFHTRDAVERDDSSMTFELPADRLRTEALRVALASCEFPMVQYTVEEDWNRLYAAEGVRLDGEGEGARALRLALDGEELELLLPARLAGCTCTWRGQRLVVDCDCAHGLFSEATGRANAAAVEDAGVHLLGDAAGDLVARSCGELEYVSPRSFAFVGEARALSAAQGARFVHVPTCASPARLCEWLTHAARGVRKGVRIAFRYDARADRVLLTANADEGAAARLEVRATALSRRLGLSSAPLELSAPGGGGGLATLPSEPTDLWGFAEVPPGFYGPCHRSMCTGAPLRIGDELESAANRRYFAIGKPPAGGASAISPHALVFSDPSGRAHSCAIPCGRYSAAQLCQLLEQAMTEAVRPALPELSFSVDHAEGRFAFACERRLPSGLVEPAPFGLLFHHPLSIDGARLGFGAQPLAGQDTYVAPRRTAHAGAWRNVLRVGDVPGQKRFALHGAAPPSMVAVVAEGSSRGLLVLRTHVNGLPFAHGLAAGDVVSLGRCGRSALLDPADGAEVPTEPVSAQWPAGALSAVVAAAEAADSVLTLRVHAPSLEGLAETGRCLQVACRAEPWSLCFARKPRSLPAHLMGFPERAVLWGADGSVGDARGRLLPPFEAPFTHCLDHPDYVLITFSESGGTALEHSYDGESRSIFCKLSLYPLFREERMLPRDTSLLRSNLSRFTLAFWNPDLRTPYRFHGAEFSFSLSFVSAPPA